MMKTGDRADQDRLAQAAVTRADRRVRAERVESEATARRLLARAVARVRRGELSASEVEEFMREVVEELPDDERGEWFVRVRLAEDAALS